MVEGGGEAKWLSALLGVHDPIPGPSQSLIRKAEKPEGEATLHVSRDQGVDAVQLGANLDRLFGHLVQKPGVHLGGRPKIPLPELGPGMSQLRSEAELGRILPLRNTCELVDARLRPVELGTHHLRVPDHMDDLEELPRLPHLPAEGASALVVFAHFR